MQLISFATHLWLPKVAAIKSLASQRTKERADLEHLVIIPEVHFGAVADNATGNTIARNVALGIVHTVKATVGFIQWQTAVMARKFTKLNVFIERKVEFDTAMAGIAASI